MSYADVAASGPKQTDAEDIRRMPDPVPEIEHSSDAGVRSLDSLDSSHVSSQPSYADQQLAHERAQEAEDEAKRFADKTAQQARDFTQHAESELERLEKEQGKKFNEFSQDAKNSYEAWKKQASKEYEKVEEGGQQGAKKAEAEAKKGGRWAEDNKGNPVVVGNAVVITALGALLGVGAYRLHQRNELTWKIAGAWAGAVGLFAVADYYVSQYFFKKYPPKQ